MKFPFHGGDLILSERDATLLRIILVGYVTSTVL